MLECLFAAILFVFIIIIIVYLNWFAKSATLMLSRIFLWTLVRAVVFTHFEVEKMPALTFGICDLWKVKGKVASQTFLLHLSRSVYFVTYLAIFK